jgi:hypothetical protein
MTRTFPAALAVLGLLAAAGATRADVGVPGFKGVDTLVSLDNMADFPDHVFFFVVPGWVTGERTSGPPRPAVPPRVSPGSFYSPGYPLRFHHQWMLVALPRRQAEKPDLDWAALAAVNPGVLHSNHFELAAAGVVFLLNPKSYELYHFQVSLADGRLTVTPGPVESVSFEVNSVRVPTWIPGLALTAAFVGLGLWIIRRRRRRSLAAKVG